MKKFVLLFWALIFGLVAHSQTNPKPKTGFSKGSSPGHRNISVLVTTPDMNGFNNAAIPQLMQYSGVNYTVTNELGALSLDEMLSYDVVWAVSVLRWDVNTGTTAEAWSNKLGAFINAGGKLLESHGVNRQGDWGLINGSYMTENKSPFNKATTDRPSGTINSGAVALPNHPIMEGVGTIASYKPLQDVTVRDNATLICSWGNSFEDPLIAINDNIVATNACPIFNPYMNIIVAGVSADGFKMFHNAIVWLHSQNVGPLGHINGTIVDSQGTPMPGVKVEIEGSSKSTISDDSGQFSFRYMAEGSYTLTVTHTGYSNFTQSVSVSANQTTNVAIVLNSMTSVSVSGVVKSEQDPAVGLPGAVVKLSGYFNYQTVTGADGSFIIDDVFVNQTYSLKIEAPAHKTFNSVIEVANSNLALGDILIKLSHIIEIPVGQEQLFPALAVKVPFDFNNKHSFSQTIYYPSELNISNGALVGLSYSHSFFSEVEDKTIRIWVGHTQKENFVDDQWIDPYGLTLVYDGNVSIPAGEGRFDIVFNDHFVYTGGNLVVYTQRVYEDFYYLNDHDFYCSLDAGSLRTKRTTGGDYNSGAVMPPLSGTVINHFPNTVFHVYTNALGSVAGVVTDGTNPVENVKVSVVGKQIVTYTNANGEYVLNNLIPDEYSIDFSLFGYEDYTEALVEVEPGQATPLNVSINAIPQKLVSGVAGGNDGVLIENALVKLEGYQTYEVTTDSNGAFLFPSVYAGNYSFTISATGYDLFHIPNILIEDDANMGMMILVETILTPGGLSVDVDGQSHSNALFSWYPTQSEFRYDDGVVKSQIGIGSGGTFNSVFGSVHRHSALVSEVSWFLTNEGGPHANVKVWIFGLDVNGNPDRTNVLYYQDGVPNVDMQWNTLQLPQMVDAPNGFLLGLSYGGFLGLGRDDGINDWPFQTNTHFYTYDVSNEGFIAIETIGSNFTSNFMIRALGIDRGEILFEKNSMPMVASGNLPIVSLLDNPVNTNHGGLHPFNGGLSKSFAGYNVYLDGELQASGVQQTHFLFTNLDEGAYTAGVQAVYTTSSSAIVSTNFDMIYRVGVNVEVATNSGDSPEGALVKLSNQIHSQYQYSAIVQANGNVVFPEVQPGTYTLKIAKPGFDTYILEDILINEASVLTAELVETLIPVFGLLVEAENVEDGSAHVSWNNIIGDLTFIDSFEDGTFNAWSQFIPGPGVPGSTLGAAHWHITDQLGSDVAPDGQNVARANWGYNINTWLISPVLFVEEGSCVTFDWLSSYTWSVFPNPNAQLMVKVSADGGQSWAEIWNWQNIGVWNNYVWYQTTVGLEDYLHQSVLVAFNLVANDNAVTQIDHVRIGKDLKNGTRAISFANGIDPMAKAMPEGVKSQKIHSGYNIYLNDMTNSYASGLTNSEFTFENLEEGTHVVGVQSVYTSGVSEIVTEEFQITYRVNVNFNITTNAGASAEGALVKLFNNQVAHYVYEGVVGSNNQILLQGVRKGSYTVQIDLAGYHSHNVPNYQIGSDITIDVEMIEIIEPPFGLEISWEELDYGQALFKWNVPQQVEFRHDDGVAIAALGANNGTLNSILGSAHRVNAELTEMSWFLTDMGGPHAFVKVWVFGLDANGNPDRNNLLYSQENVPNVDLQWSTYVFPTPIHAPNGFYLGVSYEGFIGLGRDAGTGAWPFQPNTHFVVIDVAAEDFIPVEAVGNFPNNFMIRALGYNNGALNKSIPMTANSISDLSFTAETLSHAIETSLPDYVMRKESSSNRQLLGFNVFLDNMEESLATVGQDTEFIFTDLDNGVYVAGVQSVYTTGVSEIVTKTFVFNNELPVYNVTFRVHFHHYQGFNPADDVVYITGSMFDWAEPGVDPDNQMLQVSDDDPMVYTKTLALPYGVYLFKYALNEGWSGAEWDEGPNRVVVVENHTTVNSVFGNINDPVGLEEAASINVKLFPNPATDRLKIQSEDELLEVRFFNTIGQAVYSEKLQGLSHEVFVSDLPFGVYFVQVLSAKGITTFKVQIVK